MDAGIRPKHPKQVAEKRGWNQKTLLFPQYELIRRRHARRRRATVGRVQLHQTRAASSAGSSAAFSACHYRRGAPAVELSVQPLVRQDGTAIDSAGEVVAGAPAAGSVLGAQ